MFREAAGLQVTTDTALWLAWAKAGKCGMVWQGMAGDAASLKNNSRAGSRNTLYHDSAKLTHLKTRKWNQKINK